ncbi:MAG TPA: DinB family protein [Chitinophagaceae bacterium]|nr:DinB family protein [Chitinophagaceae bacterium]
MKYFILCGFILACQFAMGQKTAPRTTRQILLDQLKTTHNKEEWFVPVNVAIAGLTAKQANWKPDSGSHSIAQLTYHLIYWDEAELALFKGEKPRPFNGNNDITFENLDHKTWRSTAVTMDSVLTAWENAITQASDAKLEKWYDIIGHVSTHNAYHIGEILYVRKLEGVWNPANGVR